MEDIPDVVIFQCTRFVEIHAVLIRELQSRFVLNDAPFHTNLLSLQIRLVGDQNEAHVAVISISLCFLEPLENVVEALHSHLLENLPRNVVHQESSCRVFVVVSGDGLVVFRPTGVPDFDFDGQFIDDECLRDELWTGSRWNIGLELRVVESTENAGLAHAS